MREWRKSASTLKREIIASKKKVYQNFLEKVDYRKDGTKVHKFISKLNNKQNQTSNRVPIKSSKGELSSDRDIAEAFTKHYTTSEQVSKEMKTQENHIKKTIKRNILKEDSQNIFNKELSMEELKQAISLLKCGKAPGPDGIMTEFIKHLGPMALNTYLSLFNQIWRTTVPSDWKKSIVIPILKPNKNPDSISSYRPISLTSILGKTMESMVQED